MRRPRILNSDALVIVKITGDGGVDDDGVPTSGEVRHAWDGVNVQRVGSTELTDLGRNTTEVVYRVAGDPPPVAVDSEDKIEWLGDTYLVDAEPDIRTGRGRIEHASLMMTRVRG